MALLGHIELRNSEKCSLLYSVVLSLSTSLLLNVFKLVYKGCGQDNYILDANHGALLFLQVPQTFMVIS